MDFEELTVEQYLTWKDEGLSDKKILQRMYYSEQSNSVIQQWKKKNGLLKRKHTCVNGRLLDHLTVMEYISYKNKGMRNADIAKKFNVAGTTLAKWIKEQKEVGNLPKRHLEKVEWLLMEQLKAN